MKLTDAARAELKSLCALARRNGKHRLVKKLFDAFMLKHFGIKPCAHDNRTLIGGVDMADGREYRIWRCDDCGHEWTELAPVKPDALYRCNGDCAGCSLPEGGEVQK
jgi:hypothetical protein